MAAPTYQATGTLVHGTTGVISPTWPTHQSGDIAFLLVESPGQGVITLTTPAGFTPVTYQMGTAQSGGTRLSIWWCRATSSAMGAPSVQSSSNHIAAAIVTVRGAISAGDPVEVFGYTNKSAVSTSVAWPAITTVTGNCLILNIGTRNNDAAGVGLSSVVNTTLLNVNKGLDDGTTEGNGGGIFTVSGTLSTPGYSGKTTGKVITSANMLLTLAIRSEVPNSIYMRQRSLSNVYTGGSSVTLPADTVTGSLIVVDITQYNTNPVISNFSDNQSNIYSAVHVAIDDGDVDHLLMIYAKNTRGGPYVLSFTGNSVGATVVVTEYIGVDTIDPLDQVGVVSSGVGTVETASITTTIDNELYHVLVTDSSDDFAIYTPVTGFKSGIQQGDILNYIRLGQADSVQLKGTVSAGFTVPSTSLYAVVLASFKSSTALANNNGFFNLF